jgi:acyl dehydratase
MSGQKVFGTFFEEFEVGSIIVHPLSKTITESDNNLFCLLTMNHHPVHLDKEYAKQNKHGQILVVGTLVFSLGVGLTVPEVSGKAIANLEYSEVVHLAPVHINDTISAKTTILDKRISKTKDDRGIVSVETVIFNQHGDSVLRFRRKVLVKKANV